MKRLFTIMWNLQTHYHFKFDFQKEIFSDVISHDVSRCYQSVYYCCCDVMIQGISDVNDITKITCRNLQPIMDLTLLLNLSSYFTYLFQES